MSNIDWIQLWLLNDLVCRGSPVSWLTNLPREEQSPSYWSFPARAAFRATGGARIDALLTCVMQGWIEVCPGPWLTGRRFGRWHPLRAEDCRFDDPVFFQESEAFLTLSGHQKWEAEFQPDWGRFWSVDDHREENSRERDLFIFYASDEILDELLRWVPIYWELDRQVGVTELGCHTTFQYQAACWVVLPWVKVLHCKGQGRDPEELSALYAEPASAEQMRKREERAAEYQASRVLSRLSKKWLCVNRDDDAEPRVRPEYTG